MRQLNGAEEKRGRRAGQQAAQRQAGERSGREGGSDRAIRAIGGNDVEVRFGLLRLSKAKEKDVGRGEAGTGGRAVLLESLARWVG